MKARAVEGPIDTEPDPQLQDQRKVTFVDKVLFDRHQQQFAGARPRLHRIRERRR